MQKIVYISADKLHPHPDNPRKDLGDLTELSESIKAKGVLQNLTVVPVPNPIEEVDAYRIIIGHRRHAAAKLAGLTELPCVVTDMTPQEQFETMMVENVQRSDLTVYEQAEGFQIMLDMGSTVEQVAQKTGFSASTVRSRVKLMQLDKEKFRKAEQRGGTLNDYLKLNMIQDPEERNRVLDTIGTANFQNNLKNALDEQSFRKELEANIKLLQDADWCKEKTDEDTSYGSGYRTYFNYYRYNRKPIPIPKDADVATYIYQVVGNDITIYRKGPEPEKKKNPEEERKDRYSRKAEKIATQLESISKTHCEMRKEFVKNFTTFNNDQDDIVAFAAKAILSGSYGTPSVELIGKVTGCPVTKKNYTSVLDKEMWNKMLFNQPLRALLGVAYARLERDHIRYCTRSWDSNVSFSTPKHSKEGTLDLLYEGLCSLGYEMSDEEIQMQNGTHPLFQEAKDLIDEYKNGGKKEPAKKSKKKGAAKNA